MTNIAIAVPAETCQLVRLGKLSRIAVLAQPCRATKLPTPKTNSIVKKRIAKS